MENLLIDIGNTSVKIALSKGTEVLEVNKYRGNDILKFVENFINGRIFDVIVVSSVRDTKKEDFNQLSSSCKKLVYLDDQTKIPIINKYSTPSTLGSDRIAAAVAAVDLFPSQNCIIFDFGTAITIDFISDKGEFRGGNISVGLRTRFKSLNHFTQKLPLLDNPQNISDIGGSTAEAIENGVVLGAIFEVEGYIKKYPGYNYIFTGGDAIYFAEKLKSSIFVVYNLVLMGLARIADYHAEN